MIETLSIPKNFKTHVENAEFHLVLNNILEEFKKDGKILAPTFAFIDPFGFSGIPFNIVSKLLEIPKVEVFITFMVDSINRFIETSVASKHIEEMFGSAEAAEIIKSSNNREKDLKELYQRKLKEKAKYVRYFKMLNNDDRPIYYLFFASNSEKGHLKMKESMWRVDKQGGFKFSDGTDQDQMLLFDNENFGEYVWSLIKRKFVSGKIEVASIKKFIENETAYLEKHAGHALNYAEIKSLIVVDELKKDGKKRRAKTFPDEVIINIK